MPLASLAQLDRCHRRHDQVMVGLLAARREYDRAFNAAQVVTFPISIARPGWSTPLGQTRIIAKDRDPAWIVPKNILEEHRREGRTCHTRIP